MGLVYLCACAGVVIQCLSGMTNLSIVCITSSCMLLGAGDHVYIASVSWGNAFQVVHAIFLPCATKVDTMSQPVRAWNIGSSWVILVQPPMAILWAVKCRKCLREPNASQNLYSASRVYATDTANTATLVSTVLAWSVSSDDHRVLHGLRTASMQLRLGGIDKYSITIFPINI